MDGVGSTFAVVSLAIQLVETGEKISSFFASVQDAPSEVISLAQTLDQLNSTLNQVSYLLDQQYLARRLPGSPVFMTNALKNCEKRMRTLESVTLKAKTAMDHRSRVHRSLAAMRFVSKKEDIREMQSQLRDAEAGLQTAMLSNSWQLQYVCPAVNLQGSTNHRTECMPSASQALALYKLHMSNNHHNQNLSILSYNMRACEVHLPFTKVIFVPLLRRQILSGIVAFSDV